MKSIEIKGFWSSLFVALIVWSMGHVTNAQQNAQYTQYMYNPSVINPAYTGSRGHLSAVLGHRSQWVGINGAPETQFITLDHFIERSNLGLGLNVVKDQLGPAKESSIAANFSYRIRLSRKTSMAFGINASANFLDVDFSKLNPEHQLQLDASALEGVNNLFSPNVGVGLFVFSDRSYFGVSIPALLEVRHYKENGRVASAAKEKPHFYGMAGTVMDWGATKFKPTLLVKAAQGAPLAVDLSANFLFNETFSLGAAYRWDAAISGLAGFQIARNVLIGYAYDHSLHGLRGNGSHEIFIRWDFLRNFSGIRKSRFF